MYNFSVWAPSLPLRRGLTFKNDPPPLTTVERITSKTIRQPRPQSGCKSQQLVVILLQPLIIVCMAISDNHLLTSKILQQRAPRPRTICMAVRVMETL